MTRHIASRRTNKKFRNANLIELLESRRLLSTVTTDKTDYGFGETALISGAGYTPNETVQLQVQNAPGYGSNSDPQNQPWTVQADAAGNISASWIVNDPDANGALYILTATGLSSGETSTSQFTDANVTALTINSPSSASPQTITNVNSAVNVTVTYTYSAAGSPGGTAGFDLYIRTSTNTDIAHVTFTDSKSVTNKTNTHVIQVPAGTANGTYNVVLVGEGGITATQTGAVIVSAPPNVVSINRNNPSPTKASTVAYTVTFSESVTGVDSTDFALANTGLIGPSIGSVTGGGNSWIVTVNTGSGDGTLGLNLVDDDSIIDSSGNKLGGTGTGNGNFTGQVYTVDRTPPTVSSIVRAASSPTNATSVTYTVNFSESVTGVDKTDFALANIGVTGDSISSVTGSGAAYTVTVATGTGDGTIGLNLVDDDSIADLAGNVLAGTGLGNGNFTGQIYTIDKTPATVASINRAATSPTNAASVTFNVTFSENVTGVDPTDFALANSGLVAPQITGVTGSGNAYVVTVSTGNASNSGTLGLNLVDDDSIIDSAGNKLGGTGTGNGNFTGQVYTIDKTAPTVSSINRTNPSPTYASSVQYTVTFSESVTGVDSTDFSLVQAGGVAGALISNVTGSGDSYTITVTTGAGDGTLGLNLVDDDSISDLAGNKLGGTGTGNGNSTGQVYTINKSSPSFGGAASDVYYVDLESGNIDVYNASSAVGTPMYSFPAAVVTALNFNITTAGGSLTVDLTGGNPIPSGGISFNGNSTRPLSVLGDGSSSATVAPSSTTSANGTATIGGQQITYTAASSVSLTNFPTLMLQAGGAGNLAIDSAGVGLQEIDGTVAIATIAPVIFSTGTAITIDDTGTNDTLTVNSAVTSLHFIGGTGNNTLNLNAGSMSYSSDAATDTPNLTLNVGAAASVSFAATQHLAALNITGSVSLTPGRNKVLVTNELSTSGAGQLNVNDNTIIVEYSGTSPLPSLLALLNSGRNSGAWNGSGISSSSAAANSSQMALGYGEASDLALDSGGSYDGQAISDQAVIITYTYLGDANLDGQVTTDDIFCTVAGYWGFGTGWAYGDFDYSNSIDDADFDILTSIFNAALPPI